MKGKSIWAWMEDDIIRSFNIQRLVYWQLTTYTLWKALERDYCLMYHHAPQNSGAFSFLFFFHVMKQRIRGSAFVSKIFSVPGRDKWVEVASSDKKQSNRKLFRFSPAGTPRLSPLAPFLCLGAQTFWRIALRPRNSDNLMDNMTSRLLTSQRFLFHKFPCGCSAKDF